MIELRERDFDAFFRVPFEVYGADSGYVSPMHGDLRRFLSLKNPLFSAETDFTWFTAHRDGRAVGRITAHLHKASNVLFDEARGCFGYFDCEDSVETAGVLLKAAESWARGRGMTRLTGNFNLTAMQQAGIVTAGHEYRPYTDQIWGPHYLPQLLESHGYARHFGMTTFERRLDTAPPQLLPDDQRQALLNEGFIFAPVTRRTIDARLEDARTILNVSFLDNPMFVPVTAEEFAFQAKDMKWVMDPRISKIVHFKGQPAGAVIAIPDLNPLIDKVKSRMRLSLPWHYWRFRRANTRAVVIFQGVMPEFQSRGVNPLMLSEVMRSMLDAGYTHVGGTWIGDVNRASIRQTEKSGAKPLHRLYLFSKDLD